MELEALPKDRRPVVFRRGQDLVLDYGIYQQSYNLARNGFTRLDSYGSFGNLLSAAEELAEHYRDSPIANERFSATGCLLCVKALREKLTSLDECHDGAKLADTLTAAMAMSLVGLGRRMEKLENVLPLQGRARTGLRKAIRNRHIAQENALTDDDLRSRYEAVQAELSAQATRGKLNREQAYRTIAPQFGVDAQTIKKNFLKWAQRIG